MKTNPIFLFSLPRSGSTLLQRLLAGHQNIMTVSEPWLLLPFCYALKAEGILSEYHQRWAARALKDFIAELPNQETDYNEELQKFALSLYDKANKKKAHYFLDKTPRYYLIIQQIIDIFPDAKFIFLFRNPLQILASIIKSFNHNRMCLHEYYIDLYRGPQLLAQGYRQIRYKSIAVKFEHLICNPQHELQRITQYLGIEYTDAMLNAFLSVHFNGVTGDKDGYFKYEKVESKVAEKWRIILGSKIRKKFAKKYISALNPETLKTIGYNQKDLLIEINDLRENNTRYLFDILDIFAGYIFRLFEIPMFAKKIRARKESGISLVCHR